MILDPQMNHIKVFAQVSNLCKGLSTLSALLIFDFQMDIPLMSLQVELICERNTALIAFMFLGVEMNTLHVVLQVPKSEICHLA